MTTTPAANSAGTGDALARVDVTQRPLRLPEAGCSTSRPPRRPLSLATRFRSPAHHAAKRKQGLTGRPQGAQQLELPDEPSETCG